MEAAALAIVIFNNFAVIQSIFYTKEFTFATDFTKKISSFLVKLSVSGSKSGKSTFLRGSWPYFSGKM